MDPESSTSTGPDLGASSASLPIGPPAFLSWAEEKTRARDGENGHVIEGDFMDEDDDEAIDGHGPAGKGPRGYVYNPQEAWEGPAAAPDWGWAAPTSTIGECLSRFTLAKQLKICTAYASYLRALIKAEAE